MVWELVFMLIVLKVPVVYLCAVVWWAIRAEPRPFEGAGTVASLGPPPDCDWRTRRARALRRGPALRGGGRIGRPGRVAYARARVSA
ncbi:MAG TPA: hypothetical protein VFV62_03130 [Gaiellaceae bacterium]|nr:hypothetical protein [Gaiellaceae bacterium]